jgi:nucleotide-binding universal stress UspA family protein
MKTIVLGYDGTEASARALERAADIGAAFGSSVIVTSVSTRLGGAVHGGGSGDPADPPEAAPRRSSPTAESRPSRCSGWATRPMRSSSSRNSAERI